MEIKLTTADLEQASKDYIAKLGFDLSASQVTVTISQTKIATVDIVPNAQVNPVPETVSEAPEPIVEDREVPDSVNVFANNT